MPAPHFFLGAGTCEPAALIPPAGVAKPHASRALISCNYKRHFYPFMFGLLSWAWFENSYVGPGAGLDRHHALT